MRQLAERLLETSAKPLEDKMADSGEKYWIERAQSAEARFNTLKENMGPAIERVKQFKANFGVREMSDGTIVIDFEKMVRRLGMEKSLELRQVIDEIYSVRGNAGEKPTVSVVADIR